MITSKELYPEYDEYWYVSDYQPILESFGNIVVQVDDDDYQGDSRVLYNNGKIGYLQFGWGSCSGCDALQGCRNHDEVDELIKELQDDIIWFENKQVALEYFLTHDWEGDYSWREDKQREFIHKTIEYLQKELK